MLEAIKISVLRGASMMVMDDGGRVLLKVKMGHSTGAEHEVVAARVCSPGAKKESICEQDVRA